MSEFTITVIGLGFVGLTTALGFADQGNLVFGVDVDLQRREQLSAGELPFQEPNLAEALARNSGKHFQLTADCAAAAKRSDFIFLCVGTPCEQDGQANLSSIFRAIDSLIPTLQSGGRRVLVLKSTIPPGTTAERILPYLKQRGVSAELQVATNPEFLREGHCWEDFTRPDRVVCGVADQETATSLKALYAPFACPIYSVSYQTAEFIKYLSNATLATMISFSNEMSRIADQIGGIDVKAAFEILHEDRRWADGSMRSYVYPGCGYGGYCLPKDTRALYAQSRLHGYEPELLSRVIAVNEDMPRYVAEKIAAACRGAQRIGVLGLSFKPGSDDVRMSVAAPIIRRLLANGFEIHAYDPAAAEQFQALYQLGIVYHSNKEHLLEACGHIALLTAWEEFRDLNLRYPDKIFVDCRYQMRTRS